MLSFTELPLSPLLLKSITDMGFEKPSPIQVETLPILLGEATDFIGLAATGTGKTAAFTLPLLEKINPQKKGVQALVLTPTRELALQVAGQISLMGKAMGVKALPVYGGSSFGDQVYGLKQGATVVVGTPGRLVDHLERGTLALTELVTIVLDEADEMISMGFREELEKIMASAQRDTCKIWLFSATMNGDVRVVANKYLKSPKQVQVNKKEMLSETVEQIYYHAQECDKPDILCKLIDMAENFYGLVFCQTKSLVVDLAHELHDRGYKVDSLHGDKDQNARERTMNAFRARKVNILICTDVASRGLDVKDITHVINYSLPRELDNYVHRIGRTARSGKSGIAMSLVTQSHRVLIQRIERMTKSRFIEGRIPSRRDIASKKVSAVLDKFSNQSTFNRSVELLSPEWQSTLNSMTSQEVAGRFLSMLFPDIGVDAGTKREELSPRMHTTSPTFTSKPVAPSETQNIPAKAPVSARDYKNENTWEQKSPYQRRTPAYTKSSRFDEGDQKPRSSFSKKSSSSPHFNKNIDEPTRDRPKYQSKPSFEKTRTPYQKEKVVLKDSSDKQLFAQVEPQQMRTRDRFPKHEGPNRSERRRLKFGESTVVKQSVSQDGGQRPPRRTGRAIDKRSESQSQARVEI